MATTDPTIVDDILDHGERLLQALPDGAPGAPADLEAVLRWAIENGEGLIRVARAAMSELRAEVAAKDCMLIGCWPLASAQNALSAARHERNAALAALGGR